MSALTVIQLMGRLSWIVVMDADNKNCIDLKNELIVLWKEIAPDFNVVFRISIEEMEAWYLGDQDAIRAAYPGTREGILLSYTQDAICGTWEKLADAIEHGGAFECDVRFE